jgi:hypothetical protein
LSRASTFQVWSISLIVHLLIYLAVGLAVDYFNPAAENVLGIFDDAELAIGTTVWLIFVPVVWAYYRWLPAAALDACKKIEELGIVPVTKSTKGGPTMLSTSVRESLSAAWIPWLAVAATVVSISYLLLVSIPVQRQQLDMVSFWHYTPAALAALCVVYTATNYVLFVFVFRMIQATLAIWRFFRKHAIVRLYPLHPDKCGGMGPIGLFVSRLAIILIVIPVWVTMLSIFTIIAGGEAQFSIGLVAYVIYAILMPVVVIPPLWQPHKAMQEYKDRLLLEISRELLEVKDRLFRQVKADRWDKLRAALESYDRLENIYSDSEKHIPVSPIPIPTFGAILGSPIVVGALGYITKLVGDYYGQVLNGVP